MYKILAVLLVTFGLFVCAGEKDELLAAKKKTSWIKKASRKIKRSVKKTAKKTKRAFVKAGSNVTNAVMDSAVKAKAKITGKKAKKTWVKGHYKKGNKKHTKGHFRKVSKKKNSHSGNTGAQGGAALPAGAF